VATKRKSGLSKKQPAAKKPPTTKTRKPHGKGGGARMPRTQHGAGGRLRKRGWKPAALPVRRSPWDLAIRPDDPTYSQWKQQHRQHLLEPRYTQLAEALFETARIHLGATDTLADRQRLFLPLPSPPTHAPPTSPLVVVIAPDDIEPFRELMERAHHYGVVEAKRLDLFDRYNRAVTALAKEDQREGSNYDSRARAFLRALYEPDIQRDAHEIQRDLTALMTTSTVPWRYQTYVWGHFGVPPPKGGKPTDPVCGPMSKLKATALIAHAWIFPSRDSARNFMRYHGIR